MLRFLIKHFKSCLWENSTKLLMITILFYTLSGQARTSTSASSSASNQYDQIIFKAYAEEMNKKFLTMSNLSKKSANAKEFLQKFLELPADSEMNKKLDKLASIPVQPIIKIKDGIEIQDQVEIKLSPTELGELIITNHDSKAQFKWPSGNQMYSWVNLLLIERPANALFLNSFEKGSDLLAASFSAKNFREAASNIAKGTAYTAGGMTGMGCLVFVVLLKTLEDTDGADSLVSCAAGAATGITLSAGAGLVTSIAVAGKKPFEKFAQAYKLKPFAGAKSAPQVVKDAELGSVVGKVGITAFLVKTFDKDIFYKGTQLECTSPGEYCMRDLKKTKTLYCSATLSLSDLSSKAYQDMTDKQKNMLLESLKEDMNKFRQVCKKHGDGYSEKIYFATGDTTRAVRDDQQQSKK